MITPSYAPTATERVLPRLALDFTTALLDARVTVTRALNTATRVNSSGFIEVVNADLPRFDYTLNTGGACKGLLIEETRANLLLQSSAFNEAVWAGVASGTGALPVVTPNYGISPDGTQSADRVQLDSGAAGSSQLTQNIGTNVSSPHTYSIFLRSLTGDVTVTLFALDDVKNVTVTSAWQRFDFVRSISTSTPAEVRIAKRDVWGSTGTADLLVYGAQLEAGAFATSYVPTTTTSLTRNADVVSMTGTNFSSWYSQSEGTFVMDYDYTYAGGSKPIAAASDGTASNRVYGLVSAGQPSGVVTVGGVAQANISNASVPVLTPAKTAFAAAANNYAIATNGGTVATDISGTMPTVDRLELGRFVPSGVTLNGHIRKLSYWPQALTGAEVQAFSK